MLKFKTSCGQKVLWKMNRVRYPNNMLASTQIMWEYIRLSRRLMQMVSLYLQMTVMQFSDTLVHVVH